MIDFDKLFEEFMVDWYKSHKDEFESAEEIEDKLPEMYNEWADAPSPKLGGIAPRAFFDKISSAEELMTLFLGMSAGGANPCALLLDRILQVPECMPWLKKIIGGAYEAKQKQLAVSIYTEMGGESEYPVFASWIASPDAPEELKVLAAEIMFQNPDLAKEYLYPLADSANYTDKLAIADILSRAGRDDRTYEFLDELLDAQANIPHLAAYIGRYGDERFAAKLYKMLDECNYSEFIEITNAIERLGGTVDCDRDFSDDEYYKAIKGLK